MNRIPINPTLLQWARKRSGIAYEDLVADRRLKNLPEWESGTTQPTLRQVETFARKVHVPVGYLFLSQPPEESIPFPDFRTFSGTAGPRPSPNLLDTIYACQARQSWFREFVQQTGQPELGFFGSASVEVPPERVAGEMGKILGFDIEDRRNCASWAEARRLFIRQAENAGMLVMVSGVVGSNNRRALDLQEFRGFALADSLAPLIFINNHDTMAAQMFTLAHEIAHIWLGTSALSDIGLVPGNDIRGEEKWCNAVAAELLVPRDTLRKKLIEGEMLAKTLQRLTRIFKVSTLVILRRLLDVNWIHRERFDVSWEQEIERFGNRPKGGKRKGDFYGNALARAGFRFTEAVIFSTLEGKTLYRDAFRMLGISSAKTFNRLGREVGVLNGKVPS